jgi:squalene-hopene/tetraprenyl-beta-curcumene cyclase
MIANKDGGVPARETGRFARRLAALLPAPSLHERLSEAMEATRGWLLGQQHDEGYWVGELEGDTILESEYVLLMAYLGRLNDPTCAKACRYIHEKQLPGGGWAIYPGGPSEVSASVKAYFALKLLGFSPDDPVLRRARAAILAAGGAQASNSFTRFYLALLGQIEYDDCPSVPPELVLLPSWLNFSLAAMSAWTRTIVVPLSIISAFKPVRRLAPELGVAELFRTDLPRRLSRRTRTLWSWANLFLLIDRALKWCDRWVPRSWRQPAIQAAHRWILEHCENTDGLGAIFPPMISTVIAFECLGYERDSALVQWALRQLDDLMIEERESMRLQPCLSPIWDTAITTIALADASLPAYHPALLGAVHWMLAKEVRRAGDWVVRRPGVEPSGWHFQFNNERYPDLDDTAMVLLALQRTALSSAPAVQEATRRGLNWLLAMQNRDGGWAAYDVDIDNEVLTKVPFADHNAMLDPSCADITARVLELLGTLGYRADHPAAIAALGYLWRTQEPEGCWYGRWGVNYVYGTWQVLQGLRALQFPMRHPALVKAADWLESVQQEGGGWGESCASYDDPSLKGQGVPTASQTAWAVLGLVAAGRAGGAAVRRGIDFLLRSRRPDGTWDEECYTGTGFPRVFYLKYHLYRVNFPLMAIARYQAAIGQLPAETECRTNTALACRIPALPRPFDI